MTEGASRRVLYLEPVGGIAGDMFLAAALDLGVELPALEAMLAGLGVSGYRLVRTRAERHAIVGTHLDVVLEEAGADAGGHGPEHRGLREIEGLIRGATSMPPRARERALAVFQALGAAEAKIHGVPPESVHFHEVGAVDSIVDICGAACVLELLGDPEVLCTPPPLGSGTIRTAHGPLPVPAPATLELLKDVPVRFEGVGELVTPTGAALLKVLARVGAPPPLTVERTGYGVGTKDFPDRANVLRASLARRSASTLEAEPDATYVVETNLDDATPQLLAELLERLLAAGALDASIVPCVMKKGRPGHLLSAVVGGARHAAIVELLLRESTTLGVRFHRVQRAVLERRHETVATPWGEVRVKLGLRGGDVLNVMPEFEDCRALAAQAQVPFKQVWAEAISAYHVRHPKL